VARYATGKLRRLIKTIARTGQQSDVWPIALVLVAVLVPAVFLLWFMSAAMRNERFAARQTLTDAYRIQLLASRERLEAHLKQMTLDLEKLAETTPPAAAFARCVQSGLVDSVVLFDEQGRVIYPNEPSAPESSVIELEQKWTQASHLEHRRKDLAAAAKVYGELAAAVTNVNQRARAFQAQARCLVQAGAKDAAIRLIAEALGHEQYDRAVDPQGRLIAANADLMALELIADKTSPGFDATARRLKQRVMDYENPILAAPQRRFLMREFAKLSGEVFPMLAAEERAAAWRERNATMIGELQFTTPNRRVTALTRAEKLIDRLNVIASEAAPDDANITLVPPATHNPGAFVSVAAGDRLPGWMLALALKDAGRLDTLTKHRTALYLWTGVLFMAVMGVLTLLTVRVVRRQTALARLKNDLAATVSHELKTPLASMRVLVDTLLNAEKLDEQTTREYLGLVAQENERLSRLIQNFLTFSRMEQKKHTFHFAPCSAKEIMDSAVEVMRERLSTPGCQFEVHAEPDLPGVTADRDALASALINLLENAWKYSGDIKHIVLSARSQSAQVLFSVQDNGVGITPRECTKIFQSFYQIDRPLSRTESGCGLGLSIVQFIATAHKGSVSVQSEPGRGSTFTIALPAAATAAVAQKEAIA
jgi:signal transduction histidine kinase